MSAPGRGWRSSHTGDASCLRPRYQNMTRQRGLGLERGNTRKKYSLQGGKSLEDEIVPAASLERSWSQSPKKTSTPPVTGVLCSPALLLSCTPWPPWLPFPMSYVSFSLKWKVSCGSVREFRTFGEGSCCDHPFLSRQASGLLLLAPWPKSLWNSLSWSLLVNAPTQVAHEALWRVPGLPCEECHWPKWVENLSPFVLQARDKKNGALDPFTLLEQCKGFSGL